MHKQIRQWAARAAVLGGLTVVVAAVVDWLTSVGSSINDPMNPRWREAVALLAPGIVIVALGLVGIQAHFTGQSLMGAGAVAGMATVVLCFGAIWTI